MCYNFRGAERIIRFPTARGSSGREWDDIVGGVRQ